MFVASHCRLSVLHVSCQHCSLQRVSDCVVLCTVHLLYPYTGAGVTAAETAAETAAGSAMEAQGEAATCTCLHRRNLQKDKPVCHSFEARSCHPLVCSKELALCRNRQELWLCCLC
jgi:hypothetical protein